MAVALQKLNDTYHYLLEEKADLRTKDFFLVTSPFPVLLIVAFYLYFCISLGPNYMKHRKPFKLRKVLLVYNAVQVAISVYLMSYGTLLFNDYFNLCCQPLDYTNHPIALQMANGTYYYYLAKITELLDTVFFVLRKKHNQVTFLHLYHHASMPLFSWFGTRYVASGNGVLAGLLNCIIHVFMYTYYLLAGLGPKYQKYLWWKKHITDMQLIQFAIIFTQSLYALVSDCAYPKPLSFLCLLDSGLFLYLFGKFYIKSYITNKDKKEDKLVNGKTKKPLKETKQKNVANGTLTERTTKISSNGSLNERNEKKSLSGNLNSELHDEKDMRNNYFEKMLLNDKSK